MSDVDRQCYENAPPTPPPCSLNRIHANHLLTHKHAGKLFGKRQWVLTLLTQWKWILQAERHLYSTQNNYRSEKFCTASSNEENWNHAIKQMHAWNSIFGKSIFLGSYNQQSNFCGCVLHCLQAALKGQPLDQKKKKNETNIQGQKTAVSVNVT